MKQYHPKISSRDTNELIAIANDTGGIWQQDAIDQAKNELTKREVTIEKQNKILSLWEREENTQFNIENLKEDKSNGYSISEMLQIFLTAPFIIVGKWTVDISLSELYSENLNKKFKQRLALLIGGTTFWFLGINLSIVISEKERQAEIDNIDISDLMKDNSNIDSLAMKETSVPYFLVK